MHEELQKQKRGAATSDAQARNLKRVVGAAQDKFRVSRSTVMSTGATFLALQNQWRWQKSN